MKTITNYLIYLILMSTLSGCERARLDAPIVRTLPADQDTPPDVFFLDPKLPMELCWDDEQDEDKVDRLRCWAQRFPELRCPEVLALERFTTDVADYLVHRWRRFLPWGIAERTGVTTQEAETGSHRSTNFVRNSLSLTLYENLDMGSMIQFVEFERWVPNRWVPWLQAEVGGPLYFGDAHLYLRCEVPIEGEVPF